MKITETHKMTLNATLDWTAVKNVLAGAALAAVPDSFIGAMSTAGEKGTKVSIRIERLTEGSPSYPIDAWRAFVEIEVDLPAK